MIAAVKALTALVLLAGAGCFGSSAPENAADGLPAADAAMEVGCALGPGVSRIGPGAPNRPMRIDRDDALRCAQAFLRAQHPELRGPHEIRVHDDRDQWLVGFHPPEDRLGGGATVAVAKIANVVLWAQLGQ